MATIKLYCMLPNILVYSLLIIITVTSLKNIYNFSCLNYPFFYLHWFIFLICLCTVLAYWFKIGIFEGIVRRA